jgi:hypothetical protein
MKAKRKRENCIKGSIPESATGNPQQVLTVPNLVSVEHWKQLAIKWNKPGANQIGGIDQLLNYFQHCAHDLDILGIQGVFNGNYELGDDGVDFITSVRQQVLDALPGKSLVWMLSFR